MGPISADARAALGAEEEENEAWKAIPGGLYLRFPVAKANVALELLKDPFDRFVDEAMARMRRRIDPESHIAEVVTYLSGVVGRPLPQPVLAAEAQEDDADDGEGRRRHSAATRSSADARRFSTRDTVRSSAC